MIRGAGLAPSPTAPIGYCADVVYAADECFIVTAVVHGHYGRVPIYVRLDGLSDGVADQMVANASRDALDRHRAAFGVPYLRPGAPALEVFAAYASVEHEVARMEDEGGSTC